MKKIYQSLGLLLALSLATSCYTDHSIAGDRPLDLIVVSNPIAEVHLDSAGWRFVAVVGYLMLIFSCIPTFWQTKISICRSAHSLFVSLRCIHCALLCKSYVCWHSCRCFKTPLSQSGRALVSSDSQSSPTSHTSVSHTIAVKLLPQRVAGHHRSYSSPTEPDR